MKKRDLDQLVESLSKKDIIPYEVHEQLGETLKTLNCVLVRAYVHIFNNSKNKKEGRINARCWEKANKANDSLKCYLEEIMFKEHPEKANLDVYYGKSKESFIEE